MRDRNQENFDEGQVCRQNPSGLERASRNAETIRQAMPVDASGTQGQSRGAPSPTPLNPHPSQVPPAAQVGNTSACGTLDPRSGHWSASTGGVRRSSPPDGRRGIRRCCGEGQLNDTDGEEAKGKRNRGNKRTAGDREPARIWEGGETPTDRSTRQQLARFRALQDPGDEGQGVGRGGGRTRTGTGIRKPK